MSAPVKMGIVVTQPTEFIERNPEFVAHVRRNMERDIRDSGRLIDDESWKREELPPGTYDLAPMTRFTLDAVSEAHVIVHIVREGRYALRRVVGVQLGTAKAAQERAEALNTENGCDERDDDGEWWGNHYTVNTVPLGYATTALQVTQEFRAQSTTDRMHDIRIGTEGMRS